MDGPVVGQEWAKAAGPQVNAHGHPHKSRQQKTRKAKCRAGFVFYLRGGRYWVRTSDPCRVKGARLTTRVQAYHKAITKVDSGKLLRSGDSQSANFTPQSTAPMRGWVAGSASRGNQDRIKKQSARARQQSAACADWVTVPAAADCCPLPSPYSPPPPSPLPWEGKAF